MEAAFFFLSNIRIFKFVILLFSNQSKQKRPMSSWFASLSKPCIWHENTDVVRQTAQLVSRTPRFFIFHLTQVTALIESPFLRLNKEFRVSMLNARTIYITLIQQHHRFFIWSTNDVMTVRQHHSIAYNAKKIYPPTTVQRSSVVAVTTND